MALPQAPAKPRLMARAVQSPVRLDDEAFFSEEWGQRVCASGLHENRFATGANGNSLIELDNPLLDTSVPFPELTTSELTELAKVVAQFPREAKAFYYIHVPAAFSATRAKVSLL